MSERTGALTSWGIMLPRQNRGWRHMTGRQRVGIVIRACLQTAVQIVAARDLLRRLPATRCVVAGSGCGLRSSPPTTWASVRSSI